MTDVLQVKSAAAGRWPEILQSLGGIDPALLDGQHHGCPMCRDGVDRFRMIDEADGALYCTRCFSKGNGDGLAALMWLTGESFSDVLNRVSEYLGNGHQPTSGNGHAKPNGKPKPKSFDEQVRWHDPADDNFTLRMLDMWATAKPPITVDAIRAAGGRPCSRPRNAHQPSWCLAFPAYRAKAGEPVGWILYRADGSDFPAIPNGPSRRKTHMLRGSKDGWVIVGGWDALQKASVVVKVEGVPDALAMHERLPAGTVVVTNICGCKSIKLPLPQFKGKRLIVVGDADTPGIEGAERFASYATDKIDDVCVAELPFEVAKDHGKDVRDFVLDGGDVDELLEQVTDHPKQQSGPLLKENGLPSILTPEGRTDIANARRFVATYGDQVRFCHPWGQWLNWDGRRWKGDNDGAPKRLSKAVSDDVWKEARESGSDVALRFTADSAKARSVSAILGLAACDVPIATDQMDADPWLLNVANGTIDLRTGELREHRQDDCLTLLCPTRFDADASSYHWDRFLESVFDSDDLIRFMQRWFGYCLTAQVGAQILPIFWGSGSNGKSTLLAAFMHALGDGYSMQAVPELLMMKRNGSHPTERADLFRKRFVSAVETENRRKLAESTVKMLTGGDRIRARKMHQDFFEFSPTHKLVLCTNHKPKVTGTDHAIWRRLALVPFAVQFWDADKGETGPPELQSDKSMDAKLAGEAEGILAWAIRGCLDWQANGLQMPAEVRAATDTFKAESDPLCEFFTECCILAADRWTKTSALRGCYEAFCTERGDRPVEGKAFTESLTERGCTAARKHPGRGWQGVGIIQDGEAQTTKTNSEQLF